ncbi:MAG: NrfD/PsrC family molybdoenzyme membrane anchor subunit, partial [Pseudomonadota bacterium]
MEVKPYEWMVTFTPQKEWISGRGLLLWLAFFFIELGAGLYLVSIMMENPWGMAAGWLVTLGLGGGLHLLYLGRPFRFWRAVMRPQTSWISRGMIFLVLFSILGTLVLALSLHGFLRETPSTWGGLSLWWKLPAGFLAFVLIVYGGFAMNFVHALPLWNTALLPILFVAGGLWGGLESALGLQLLSGHSGPAEQIESWIRAFMLGYVWLIVVYLWSSRYGRPAGKKSAAEFLHGSLSLVFYTLVVFAGMIVPLSISLYSYKSGLGATPVSLLYLGILCGLAGDLAMRFCIL